MLIAPRGRGAKSTPRQKGANATSQGKIIFKVTFVYSTRHLRQVIDVFSDGIRPIKTKSVYDSIEDSDGIRILVTRYHPRIKGFKKGVGYDEWLKDLSPIGPAVKKFKAGKMTEHEFGKQYMSYLAISNEAQRELDHVRELLRIGETVTLLCYEPEGDFCHQHLLKTYLRSRVDRI